MSSEAEICNLALSHVGVGNQIANLDTEKSEEAITCKLMYPFALGYMLRNYRWPYFTKTVTLALVNSNPNIEWMYAYRVPNESARILRILSGYKIDTPETRVKYTQAQDDIGYLILTDQPQAQADIVVNNPDPKFFPDDFTLALSYKLAMLICPRLSGGDVFKITERVTGLFDLYLRRALATTQNEEELPANEISSLQAARL